MRITHLDGLRGIAILWVIAYHAYSRWFDYTNLLSATKNISIFKYGFLGVSLFFMISGFVIDFFHKSLFTQFHIVDSSN
jgi:peptidoglycan/LPS O-acetylase OafA/YrhL